uniref:FAM91 N-terminal domain-containing protein n=1 Tax=Strigamia maritima TaxID=126957 RepID=T1J6S9_STRMM
MNSDVENQIRQNTTWSKLPLHIKQVLGDSQNDVRNQLRFKGNLIRTVRKDEKIYYEELLQYSREHLMLFPYQLSDVLVKGMRITPFQYYCNIIQDLMEQEKSYDSLPNFTAADCKCNLLFQAPANLLLGIGRNQYIDLMNQCRSSKITIVSLQKFFRRKSVREIIPNKPVADINIEPWWIIQIGYVTQDDIKVMVGECEKLIIDQIIDNGAVKAGDMNSKDVHSLYAKGLVYLDVPVNDEDYIVVPPLEGFVMNRVLGDYFETLLYKIFVSIDEHTPVSELANVLQIDLKLVKNAISMYCRLGFARRKNSDLDSYEYHPSWAIERRRNSKRTLSEDPLLLDWNTVEKVSNEVFEIGSRSSENLIVDEPVTVFTDQSNSPSSSAKKIVFLFDATLTAYLMMGNLSPVGFIIYSINGLKSHAVTMFEVGKLSDESLESLLQELDKVADIGEGEAQRYFDHALTLRSTIHFLRHNRNLCFDLEYPNNAPLGLDLIRCESLLSLESATCARLLNKNYALLVSVAPLSNEVRTVGGISPPHLGPAISEVNSIWFKLFLYHVTGYGPPTLLLTKGTRIRRLPKMFLVFDRLLVTTWGHDPGVLPVSNVLLTLNDALTHSAVLVQGYGVSADGELQYIPFPIDDSENSKENARVHSAIASLSREMDLRHSCGYVTMLKMTSKSDSHIRKADSVTDKSDSTLFLNLPVNGFKDESAIHVLEAELDSLALQTNVTPSKSKVSNKVSLSDRDWTLLDCNFGLPLFDAQLNKVICEKFSHFQLCSKESLQHLTQSSHDLSEKLLMFISEFKSKSVVDYTTLIQSKNNETEIAVPSACLSFCKGKLNVHTVRIVLGYWSFTFRVFGTQCAEEID